MYQNKPVIGLTGSFKPEGDCPQHFLNESYFHVVRHFGGIPLLIPVHAEREELAFLTGLCDGVLLTGGNDIDPALFGEELLNDTVLVAPERDRQEALILDMALERNLPILGICRGIQVLNVYFGGTLYQDIPAQLPANVGHRMDNYRTCHGCTLMPRTPLHRMTCREEINVNSHHHQAVKDLAKNLVCMGRSADGIVEAVFDPSRPFLWGVQWHPERIWDMEDSSAKVFEAFIAASLIKT